MNRVVTAAEIRACDDYAMNVLKIPSLTLMKRAARAAVDEFLKLYKGGSVAVICGGGNNGGDGLAIAWLLSLEGIKCSVFMFYGNISADCGENLKALQDTGVKISHNPSDFDFSCYDYIVDALFGTGLNREISGVYKDVIDGINQSKAYKFSVDIPSGLNSDSGKVLSVCVKADITVTFAAYKYGQLFGGLDLCGGIVLKDIGIPVNAGAKVYAKEDVKQLFLNRLKDTHKGSYGKLAIIAGSGRYFGAAAIAFNSAASLKTGAGIATLFVPRFLAESYRKHILESTLDYFPDNGENAVYDEAVINKIINDYDAVCVGMGMGVNEGTFKICCALVEKYGKKLLLDADALNSISAYDKGLFKKRRKGEILITPHLKEFSRLTGKSIQQIKDSPIEAAKVYAKENNVTVLLKGAATVITDGGETAVNITGTPAMAKAGSGDVLSGIIGSLMAQGGSVLTGSAAGAYIHGRAGELAEKECGSYSVLASDIYANIQNAIKEL